MDLESEHHAQLREQLKTKRQLLHYAEMRVARAGVGADPAALMDRDDLATQCRALEEQLGIQRPTPTPPAPRPMPEPTFRRYVEDTQTAGRQREIAHQLSMLDIHRRNLKHYRRQAEMMGAVAPPMTQYGISEALRGIAQAKNALRSYGQSVDDLVSDE